MKQRQPDVGAVKQRQPAAGAVKRIVGVGVISLVVILTTGLGVWQLERRAWKLALIERVEARIHAEPIAAPNLTGASDAAVKSLEYKRIAASGHFLNDRETLVEAVTTLGGGYWVLTPFITGSGATILVNRGYVPFDRKTPESRRIGQIEGPVHVSGLLRPSEPRGGFLRSNDPAAGRWYSRDVAAIATARGLHDVEPYFVDADSTPNAGGWPVGGLTVINFPNNHLVYALTWFSMAIGLAAVAVWLTRRAQSI